eukprot:5131524-Pyramimonas_sp.AAC.1
MAGCSSGLTGCQLYPHAGRFNAPVGGSLADLADVCVWRCGGGSRVWKFDPYAQHGKGLGSRQLDVLAGWLRFLALRFPVVGFIEDLDDKSNVSIV